MAQGNYILSIDQSTSGTKAVLFDRNAALVARETIEHQQIYPQPQWVEHDPEEIYSNTLMVAKSVLENNKIAPAEVFSLSITNQRETVVLWNKKTGKPIGNAVVWQCMRGQEICEQLKIAGHENEVREKTGLLIDPYFSASGLSWLLKNNQDEIKKIGVENLAAGTIDSWLIWKLTKGAVHATDFSNACRTLLFNIHTLQWDEGLCALFNVPENILPEIMTADAVFGMTTLEDIFPVATPISGVLGDSHGALFGQRCYQPGLSKATYGTGSSVMMNIGSQAKDAPEGLVTSIGYALKDGVKYVFEGNIHSTGATLKWMVDYLELLKDEKESEQLAESLESNHGVYFVPAFSGLGAPYWNNEVKAAISGISGGTTKAHVTRAALESIAYQVKDLVDLMIEKAGVELKEIRVDGGPTKNNFLMQFQSDMLNAPISISDVEEASALGATLAGGLGTGFWESLEVIEQLYKTKGTKTPKMNADERQQLYGGWQDAVKQLLK